MPAVEQAAPLRPEPPMHTFEPPGDGLPTCMFPNCGRARSHSVHQVGLVRTRVTLVVDHDAAFTPGMLELLIAQAFGNAPGVTLQQMNPIL